MQRRFDLSLPCADCNMFHVRIVKALAESQHEVIKILSKPKGCGLILLLLKDERVIPVVPYDI